MERAGGERPVTVTNGSGVVVIGDGNRIGSPEAPAVRSAYREQVRRIAPAELVDREAELAELAAFCLADSGPAYAWWRAEAWAGKTALLSWFALDPPPGVRIVPFFITARLGAQNDVAAYVDVVLEQLAELAGEGLPALLTAATREAHLLRLYASAAAACAARGERLVLLVDGLDEDRGVTTGPDAHSIASLLPYDLRVIVSGRLNPPLPADVPDDHPLRDPAAVRILSPSPKARAIRAEAERELKRLLEAGGLPYELLGLLTAAGGGLTADDLAELTGEVPYRVKDVLRTGPGRTFAVRGEAYLLAHEELVVGARDMLGRRVLGQRRATLHAWAEEWRAGGWPDGTPDYLLHGYFPMLRTAGDLDRMLACALDEVRHDRLQEETGGVAEALAEVRATGEAVLEHGDRAGLVATMLRLGFRRGELTRRAGDIPVELAAAWAAAGRIDRATALVRSEGRLETVHGLCAVACRLLEAGDRSTADELVTEAEGLVLAEGNRSDQELLTRYLVPALLTLGELDRAERRVRAVESDMERGRLLPPLLDALCAAGQYERAVALTEERNFLLRVAAVARVAGALAAADRAGEAEQLVREAVARDPHVAVALLLDGSRALRAAGHEERADVLRSEALAAIGAAPSDHWLFETVRALAATGEFEHLDRWSREQFPGPQTGRWGREYAEAGAWDRARKAAAEMPGATGEWILRQVADGLVEAGHLDEAEAVMEQSESLATVQLRLKLGKARLRAGDLEGAGAVVDRLAGEWHADLLAAYARALCHAGRRERTQALLDGGRKGAVVRVGIADALLDAGDPEAARELLVAAERTLRAPGPEASAEALLGVVRELAGVGRTEEARSLLAVAERNGADEALGFVSALVAVGEVDRAEELAAGWAPWTETVIGARLAEGDFDAVVRLARNGGLSSGRNLTVAVRGLADVGAWDQAALLGREGSSYDQDLMSLIVVAGMARDGRAHEAAHRFAGVGTFRTGGVGVTFLPDRVRALLALGRREEAVRLVGLARVEAAPSSPATQAQYLAEALVVLGDYEEACRHARETDPRNAEGLLLSVAGDLVREGAHEEAARLLAGLHFSGLRCAAVYADLARVHPDPVRARECAALALHLGSWPDVLPAVLHCDPGVLPLVLDEADRLRRALEV
ncbi:hypothetical protein OG357_15185 [Streptomyces sp. NBC_01255]|uniref:hypothetical protein n=1 Tax=Streptomyces sp. NBC_01255 TaxID=2903798 RepID=UPI002E35C686|nr:hypothetical protein [Streptomyces sp. NBC_01255]